MLAKDGKIHERVLLEKKVHVDTALHSTGEHVLRNEVAATRLSPRALKPKSDD